MDQALAGLWGSVFSGFLPALLVLIGIGAIIVGVVAVLQTRRWPRMQVAQQTEEVSTGPMAADAAPAPVIPPSSDTDRLLIGFPDIDAAHPDVWDKETPLTVVVQTAREVDGGPLGVRLSLHVGGRTREIGTTGLDPEGQARFAVAFDALGEHDLIAELLADGDPRGQSVRRVRIADYRNEIVETFEDFVAWASSHFDFVDRRMTAREFVDRYADGRVRTPAGPLGRIADLYELANYSEHPVDRQTYLHLVDAFLELEAAGALEGPGEA